MGKSTRKQLLNPLFPEEWDLSINLANWRKNDGKKVAVTGHEYYTDHCKDPGNISDADIVIEVAVPAQTTVELCATEASKILNKEDTVAIYGSNQVAAEGILTANVNLNVLGSDPTQNVLAVGFDAGATIKTAVRDGIMLGAVTQAPMESGPGYRGNINKNRRQ